MILRKLLVILLGLPTLAYAGMYRCTDSKGQTTYSDVPCPAASAQRTVKITDNVTYGARYREEETREYRVAVPDDSPQESSTDIALEQIRQSKESYEQDVAQHKRDRQRASLDQGKKTRAMLNYEAGLPIDATPAPVTQNIPPPPHPSIITSCDSGGCWDNRGSHYDGGGGTYVRQDGKVCQSFGGQMNCN